MIRSGEGRGGGGGRPGGGRGGEGGRGGGRARQRAPAASPAPAARPRPAPAPTAGRGARAASAPPPPELRASASCARSPARAGGRGPSSAAARGPRKPTPARRGPGPSPSLPGGAPAAGRQPGCARPRVSTVLGRARVPPSPEKAHGGRGRGWGGGRLRGSDISGIPDASPDAGMPLRRTPRLNHATRCVWQPAPAFRNRGRSHQINFGGAARALLLSHLVLTATAFLGAAFSIGIPPKFIFELFLYPCRPTPVFLFVHHLGSQILNSPTMLY